MLSYEEEKNYKKACEEINSAHNPCIVLLNPGTRGTRKFDAFPLGHPIPTGSVIYARWQPTSGPNKGKHGKFVRIPNAEEDYLGIPNDEAPKF